MVFIKNNNVVDSVLKVSVFKVIQYVTTIYIREV